MPRRRNRPASRCQPVCTASSRAAANTSIIRLGRGTDHAGPRVRLPDDPHSPEFWNAVRQAQGIVGPVPTGTINALADA